MSHMMYCLGARACNWQIWAAHLAFFLAANFCDLLENFMRYTGIFFCIIFCSDGMKIESKTLLKIK